MHPRYQEWISYVFDHTVTDPQWYFGADAPGFEGTEEDYAELIRDTFSRSGADLVRFSDAQVNQGIWFLASPTGSDFIFSLRDGTAPTPKKIAGIHSIYDLYRDCFAERCTQTLGHIDETGASERNPICYMFWDVCPLSYLEGANEKAMLEEAVFWVLEKTIELPHRACIEAGLHGLGEVAYRYTERVQVVVDRFLTGTEIDPVLRGYAERARAGCVL
jgi:hypothetical protein